jgi:50S ribosomal protein L16 3-hydroxylase
MVLDKLRDRESFARAFGKHASTPRYPEVDWAPEEAIASEELRALLGQGEVLRRNAASRFSYIAQSPDLTLLFVDGECHECAGEDSTLARQLCAKVEIALGADLSNPALELIRRLYNQGSLTFDTGE